MTGDAAMAVSGFGWSFYGFFIAAAVWLGAYFLWAWSAARRDRSQGREGHAGHEGRERHEAHDGR